MPRLPAPAHRWFGRARFAADRRALLEALPDAAALLDRRGVIRDANRAWEHSAQAAGGTAGTTTVGSNYLAACDAVHSDHRSSAEQAAAAVRAVLAGQTATQHVEYHCGRTVDPRWFHLRYTAFGGRRPGVLVCRIDISERKAGERAAAHRADHDALTGVANSAQLRQQLVAELSRREHHPDPPGLGVVFIDLDRFKPVNDLYGHAAGDQVLVEVARRLRSAIHPDATVARAGGDEFAIIVPGTTAEGLSTLEQHLADVLLHPHDVHGVRVVVGASIGSHLAVPGEQAADLLAEADRRMYEVKQRQATA